MPDTVIYVVDLDYGHLNYYRVTLPNPNTAFYNILSNANMSYLHQDFFRVGIL